MFVVALSSSGAQSACVMSYLPKIVAYLVLLFGSSLGLAKTPWGEKDTLDLVREARTFHIMFFTGREAAQAKARLASLSSRDLFATFQKIARAESKDP
jgi:hypothetical protein